MNSHKLLFITFFLFTSLISFGQNYSVEWANLNGATISTSGIKVPSNKFVPWQKGAVSSNMLGAGFDGQIDHTISSSQLRSFAFGLTHTQESAGDLNQIAHGFAISGGELMAFENGALLAMLGPVSGGEQLTIKREGSNTNYYLDDLLVATSGTQSGVDLWVAISFNEADSYVSSFTSSFPAPLNSTFRVDHISCQTANSGAIYSTISGGMPPYSVIWDNGSYGQSITNLAVGTYLATISDSNGTILEVPIEVNHKVQWGEKVNTLVSADSVTAQGDGIAVSENTLFPYLEGWAEFIYHPQALLNSVWGLAKSENQTVDYEDIDYGFSVLDGDLLAIYELGELMGIFGALTEGDKLRIQRTEIDPETTVIEYLLNGEIIREISTLPELLLAKKLALTNGASMPISYGSFGCSSFVIDLEGADSLSVHVSGAGIDEIFQNQPELELNLPSPISGATEEVRAEISFPNSSDTLSLFLTIDESGRILEVEHSYSDGVETTTGRAISGPSLYLLGHDRALEVKPAMMRDVIIQRGCNNFVFSVFGGKPTATANNQNWAYHKSYGDLVKEGDNLTIFESVSFSDGLGRNLQNQYADHAKRLILANQPVYDRFGRSSLTTLTAPIEGICQFEYSTHFIRNNAGNPYAWQDFDLKYGATNTLDAPNPVSSSSHLGKYFSELNTLEPFVGGTDYPFTRVAATPGGVVRGGSSADPVRIGTMHEVQSFSAPVLNELDNYVKYLDEFTTDLDPSITSFDKRALKVISVDQNGDESISFYGPRGNMIASCISGTECPPSHKQSVNVLTSPDYGYIDFHIPKGANGILSFNSTATDQIEIRNLASSEIIYTGTAGGAPTLTNGFYRIYDRTDITTVLDFDYEVTYYGFNYTYYDKAGRAIAETNPEAVRQAIENNWSSISVSNVVSTAQYTSWSAYKSYSVDDGGFISVRTTDGRLRFSQDALQDQNNDFSYVNYDEEGRVVESGICTTGTFVIQDEWDFAQNPQTNAANHPTIADNITNAGQPFVGEEVTYTLYDVVAPDLQAFIAACPWLSPYASEYRQTFVRGGVSRTHNLKSTTWYSYDEFGQLRWSIQAVKNEPEFASSNNFELFTTDYTYDFQGNVLEEVHDKYKPNEQLWRRFTYDRASNLRRVDFKADISALWEKQASYQYYADGGVKREEIGNDLQGIDYIYTPEGQVKAINHPDLNDSDAGRDGYSGLNKSFAPDVFGQTLDYYLGDYRRDNTHFSQQNSLSMSTGNGTEQFNGLLAANRSAIRGYNSDEYNSGVNGAYQSAYFYTYDHFYQLNKAEYHRAVSSYIPNGTGGTSSTINPIHNGDYDVFDISYDYNGNIHTLKRNAYDYPGIGVSRAMDNLTYNYDDPAHPNRLSYVGETIPNQGLGDFKFGQPSTPSNYQYNVLGFLIEDKANDLTFTYTLRDKLSQITKTSTGELYTSYEYDEAGQLLYKVDHKYQTNRDRVTLYVRGPSGKVVSIHESLRVISQELPSPAPPAFVQIEAPIYGMGRIGNYYRLSNTSLYELTDYEGNVRAVIEENKDPLTGEASLVSYASYYPFGWVMPGKNGQLNSNYNYRYGYQGQEYDPRTEWYDFSLRAYDPRLARWFNPDPYLEFYSPYVAMGNEPGIIDPTGGQTGEPEKYTYKNPLYLDDVLITDRVGAEAGASVARKEIEAATSLWGRFKAFTKDAVDKVKNMSVTQWVEAGIETAGYLPGISNVVAVIETGYNLAKGDYVAAAAAGAAIVLGPAAKVTGKLVKVVVKNLDKVNDSRKALTKVIKRKKDTDCSCFPEGTPILTLNGYKPIEAISMGDTVWSYDHQLQRPVLQKVLYPIMGEWHYVADISLEDESTLSATYDHPFFANGQWLAAGQLHAGDTLYSYIYDEATGPEQRANVVAGVQLRDTVVTVYNFGVAGTHTYYAGEQGVLVHNCGIKPNGGNAAKHGGTEHNRRIDKMVGYLKNDPKVDQIRKNQAQVDFGAKNKVGRNRPDLQYDRDGKHYNIEWDTNPRASARHQTTVSGNDPNAVNKFYIIK